MVANRAHIRSFFADNDMATIAALPNHVVVAGENEATLNVGQQFFVTLFVMFFNFTNHGEQFSNVVKTLFLSGVGETGIHIRPFVVLTGSGILQIRDRIRNFAVMQQFEPNLGMFLLISGRLFENGSYLIVTILLRFGSIVRIFVAGLRFTGKSGLQIFSVCDPFNSIMGIF